MVRKCAPLQASDYKWISNHMLECHLGSGYFLSHPQLCTGCCHSSRAPNFGCPPYLNFVPQTRLPWKAAADSVYTTVNAFADWRGHAIYKCLCMHRVSGAVRIIWTH